MTTIVKDSYTLMLGDCLERMREIPDGSVDMVLADLPYGTTACKWDATIPFDELWTQYWRVLRFNGVIALFGSQPFTAAVVNSQTNYFKYEWIWEKDNGSNFLNAKFQPLKVHESVLIFSRAPASYTKTKVASTYNAQFTQGKAYTTKSGKRRYEVHDSPEKLENVVSQSDGKRCPRSVQKFNSENGLHPTQKPVPLLEYLVRTYTSPGELVLDNTMGSGSTGVAAIQVGRRFVGVEKEPAYFEIAAERLSLAQSAGTTSDTHEMTRVVD